MVYMATNYAILENWGVPTNLLISQQQLCNFRELGCTYKLTHISAATHPRLLNIVSIKRLDITIVPNGRKCKLSYFNIHECLMKTLEMREKS